MQPIGRPRERPEESLQVSTVKHVINQFVVIIFCVFMNIAHATMLVCATGDQMVVTLSMKAMQCFANCLVGHLMFACVSPQMMTRATVQRRMTWKKSKYEAH